MANVSHWESRMIAEFVRKDKRERYLALLKGGKRRQKVLERLNHRLDYDLDLATELTAAERTHGGLLHLLQGLHVAPTCHLMADGSDLDGKELRIERGVEALLDNHWGGLLICPPKPITIYKEEGAGDMLLLRPRADLVV